MTDAGSTRCDAVRCKLDAAGQSHLFHGVADLGARAIEVLCDRIDSLPWDTMPDLIERYVRCGSQACNEPLSPARCVTVDPNRASAATPLIDRETTVARGEAIIAAGKVAAFAVAGGQGTRLGWNGPKGTFPASPVTGKPLFRLFAEQILAAQRQYDCTIRWYILTSEANTDATQKFLLDNRCFGLDRAQVMLVVQGMMPAFDATTGKVLLESPGFVAMSPDGHGGSFAALHCSGALDQMQARGVEVLSYFQVDNPLVRVIDPLLIGLHADESHSSGEFTSKMVQRSGPDEKVGVFCRIGDRTGVVEYSDLTPEQASATDQSGQLRFAAGNIAVHAIGVEFAQSIAARGEEALPWHRADKKVSCLCPTSGVVLTPDEPNAVKLERFVFDAMGQATRPAILEVERTEEFAPIKNATGIDSAESSKQLQSDLYGTWLERAGVTIPRRADGHVDAAIEISPLTASIASDLQGMALPDAIASGSMLAL